MSWFVRLLRFSPASASATRGDGGNKVSLLLPNRSRIVGLPGTEAGDRGFSGVRLLLADEASRVNEDLYLARLPVLAVSGGDLWLISTPFGKRGFDAIVHEIANLLFQLAHFSVLWRSLADLLAYGGVL